MNRSTFWDSLRESQLLPESKLAELSIRYGPGEAIADVTDRLVSEGLLTRFQVNRLEAGDAKGLVLGQYRLIEELGRGGMGCVYKAVHTVMERTVAIKLLSPGVVEDPQARAWFKREVRACTKLIHPNIVMAYDANEADGRLFLVMEYVDGPNLDALVRQRGPLAAGVACELLRQTALALQYAHERGIVHRDIKPGNLLVPRGGMMPIPNPQSETDSGPQPLVKITDFGLARLQRSAGSSTLTRHESGFLGTPDYVAPEQARDFGSADIRSDLYSLGCSFYFALSGRVPFGGETVLEKISRHLTDEAEPLNDLRSEISPALAGVIRRLMAKEPGKRFQTSTELLSELAFVCGAAPTPLRRSGLWAALERPDVRSGLQPRTEEAATETGPTAAAQGLSSGSSTAATCHIPVRVLAPGETPVPQGAPTLLPSTAAATTPAARVSEPTPAESGTPLAPDPALRQAWQQWASVVEALAEGRTARQVNGAAYRTLHARLLTACRLHASTATDPSRAFYQTMHDLAEPWLTPEALAAVDREALHHLLNRCREVGRRLGGRRRWLTLRRAALIFWMLVFATGATFAGLWFLDQPGSGFFSFRYWLRAVWRRVESDPLIWTAFALPVILTVVVTVFTRPPRA